MSQPYKAEWFPGMPSINLLESTINNKQIQSFFTKIITNIWTLLMGYCDYYSLDRRTFVMILFNNSFSTIPDSYDDIFTLHF